MYSFFMKRNGFSFVFFVICLSVAIDKSSQDTLARRLFKRSSYADSPYCRTCESNCRDRDRHGERERLGMDYVCGRRIRDGVSRTFESLCLFRCHNDCYADEKYEYRDDRECGHTNVHHDRREIKIVHDDLEHTNIPSCQKARQCYCGTICQPICARSRDSDAMYAVFHNPCRLKCTNQCSEEHEGYELADGPLCREAIREHICDFNLKG